MCMAICSVISNSCNPMDCSMPVSSVHGIFQVENMRVGFHFLLQSIFPKSNHLLCLLEIQADSLPTEPQENIYLRNLNLMIGLFIPLPNQ